MGDDSTSDRIAKFLLSVSTILFSFLMMISIVFEPAQIGQILYSLLLVVLPAAALLGALRGLSWWRGAAIFALVCVWAFLLKTAWSFGSWDHYRQAMLDGSFYFAGFTAIVAGFLFGLPWLILELNRSRNDPGDEDEPQTAQPALQLSAAFESGASDFFNEGSTKRDSREPTPR